MKEMKHTLYSKNFLARNLFSMPTLGIDLHEGGISFAALKKSGTHSVLRAHGTISLGADAVSMGVIRESRKVRQALKDIRKKTGMRYVRASIPEEHVTIVDMTLAKTEKKKVIEKIRTKLADILPAFSGEVLINYEILSEDSEEFHLNVSIARKSFVDEYLTLLSDAGFSVVSLVFRSAAIAASLVAKKDAAPKLIACLEGNRLGVFGVMSGFIFACYVSEIDQSRDFLGIKEKIDRAYIEWRKLQPEQKGISVVLCGEGARESGLADYLSVSLKLDVSLGNVWENIQTFDEYIPEITKSESLAYAAAIGLALADFEK
jgi:Tfp pilus assembly PilM family ATPase